MTGGMADEPLSWPSPLRRAARRSRPTVAAVLWATALCSSANAQLNPQQVNRGLVEVIAGGLGSTSAQIASDLSIVLDDGATRRIVPVLGKGSLQGITDLRAMRGIDLAIIQADSLDFAREHRLQPGIENAITYIARLYGEEFHLLARQDIAGIQDLAGKRVNFDVPGGGTAITGSWILKRLGIRVEATSFEPALAIQKLRSGEIDAMAYVAGKPAPLFLDRRLPSGLHFLDVPTPPEVLANYSAAHLTADDYPGLVAAEKPVTTVAVPAVLAVANLAPGSERYRNVVNFVDVFFTNVARFGLPPTHPKWREVDLDAQVPGWRRFPPAEAWLKRNAATTPAIADAQLRDVFGKFIEQRTRISSGSSLPPEQRDSLFEEFQRWQRGEKR